MERKSVLESIIRFDEPVIALQQAYGEMLSQSEADDAGAPVEFTTAHALDVLDKYLVGEIDSQDLEDWANLLEGADGVQFESPEIQKLIFDLANPALNEPISQEMVKRRIQKLA